MKRRLSVESNSPSYLLHTYYSCVTQVFLQYQSYGSRYHIDANTTAFLDQSRNWHFFAHKFTFWVHNTGEVYKRHLGLLLSILNRLFIIKGIHFFIIEQACPPQNRSAYNICCGALALEDYYYYTSLFEESRSSQPVS